MAARMPQFIDDIYNELQFLEPLYLAAADIPAIQNRYTWFLSEALDDGGSAEKNTSTGEAGGCHFGV